MDNDTIQYNNITLKIQLTNTMIIMDSYIDMGWLATASARVY